MKKLIFGIFAHPDDEAFGPAATLYKAAQSGTDVHLILVTNGENGTNIDNEPELGKVRLSEWRQSAKLIGVRSQKPLHYPDGGLNNNLYENISDAISTHITKVLEQYSEPLEIEFMTYEQNGITGHLDHIAVSYITTFVFVKFRKTALENVTFTKLRYYCLPYSLAPTPNTAWVYMACGKHSDECDEIVDFSDIVSKKLEIMQAHHSQRQDMQNILAHNSKENPDYLADHFCYFKD